MIIPEGKNKKYIKTIIGVYIMFVIVSPIIGNIGNINTEEILETKSKEYSMEIEPINFSKEMEIAYKQKLKENIGEELKNIGYTMEKFSADYETTESEFGNIKYIDIYISKQNDNNIKNIEEITINVNEDNSKQKDNITQEELEKIKANLSENCGISVDKIKINGG